MLDSLSSVCINSFSGEALRSLCQVGSPEEDDWSAVGELNEARSGEQRHTPHLQGTLVAH